MRDHRFPSRRHSGIIVMTTHGRSGFGRLLLGSVAESVLRGTSTPVLVLHPDGASVHGSPGAARPADAVGSGSQVR